LVDQPINGKEKTMEAIVAAIVVVACLVLYVRWRVRRGGPPVLMPEALNVVTFDERTITVRYSGGESRAIGWDELTMVGINTTDEGPFVADVFWGLHGRDGKPRVVYPQGATGEEALLAEMQRRLAGFDDRQLIEAMGSTRNAFFVIWQRGDDRLAA
jgi:hypothetical protein